MFDLWRDRGSTAEEKRQAMLSAYLDNALAPAERERFEAQLARDADLRAELQQLRAIKLQMRAMPRRRVPRSFALDPAVYGRPKSQPLLQLYPVLRGATALTALLFIFTLALGAFRGEFAPAGQAVAPATELVVSSEAVEEAAPAAADTAAITMEQAATSAPEAREGAPGQPEMGLAAEVTGQEAAGGDQAAETLPPESAPEALATVDGAALTEAETQPFATGAGENVAEVPPAEQPVGEEAPAGEVVPEALPSWLSLLPPVQIALAVVLTILLVLFLLARRQANRL